MSENYSLELHAVGEFPVGDALVTEYECCYECGEPVYDDTHKCCGVYDWHLAEVLGKCCICGAPNFFVYGDCPVCDGYVMHFPDTYACINTIQGTCDFSIDIDKVEEKLGFDAYHHYIKALLHEGWVANCYSPNKPYYRLVANLVFTDSGWDVKVVTTNGEK